MAKYSGTVPRTFDEVWPLLDDIARSQGWAVHLTSTKHDRVYSTNAGMNSWGITLRVRLQDSGASTALLCETKTWGIPDWFKARKGFDALLAALGGSRDQ